MLNNKICLYICWYLHQKSLEIVNNKNIRSVMRKMKYSIIDKYGNIIDRGLSYEEALMWIDSITNGTYKLKIERMITNE